jgi:hypothetical protein
VNHWRSYASEGALVGLFSLLCTSACHTVVLISPYDEVTETRLQDFREALNVTVKRAGSNTGTAAGTFEASKDAYIELEAKIDGLVDRAKMQDVGVGCKLDAKTWARVKGELAAAVGLPATNATTGDGSGCVTMMLINVQKNLASLKSIHEDPAQCAGPSPEFKTCLRPAAAKSALNISNQTIDAVLFVEQALGRRKEVEN